MMDCASTELRGNHEIGHVLDFLRDVRFECRSDWTEHFTVWLGGKEGDRRSVFSANDAKDSGCPNTQVLLVSHARQLR